MDIVKTQRMLIDVIGELVSMAKAKGECDLFEQLYILKQNAVSIFSYGESELMALNSNLYSFMIELESI